MNIDIRNLQKWLNEEQEAPIDRQALARVLAMAEQPPQQEPVYVYTCKGCKALFWENDLSCDCTVNGLFEFDRHVLSEDTSPPAPRKPLTLREIAEATNEYADVWSDKTIGIARAIEAAHNIKEQP